MFKKQNRFHKSKDITQISNLQNVNINNVGIKFQIEWILTQIHVVQFVRDVMKEIESEKSLCLEKQLVPDMNKHNQEWLTRRKE